MRITTTKCSQHRHPEFVLEADEAQVPDVYLRNIVQTIEEMVAAGSVFRPEQTFQIGWGLTLVKAAGGQLTLVEPDMQSFPIQWVPGITHTLRQMMLQLFMLDSVGLRQQMDAPSICDSLIACTRYHEPSFFLARSERDGADSGWFIGCRNDSHDHQNPANLHCISVYEAHLNQRGFQGFASFPVGSMIAIDRSRGLKVYLDDRELAVIPGSFLEEWFKS